MPPSSACTGASRIIAAPPRIHEMIAAGPAISDAPSAPNNQPEPMIDPTDVNISPTKPISRRSRGSTLAAPVVPSPANSASLPRPAQKYLARASWMRPHGYLPNMSPEPVSYLTLSAGTPVRTRDGTDVGVVDHVLADAEADIFDGLVIDARHGVGGHRF